MPFFYVDWYYIVLVLPAVILSLWASAHVKSTFRRYSQVRTARGLPGAEAAKAELVSKENELNTPRSQANAVNQQLSANENETEASLADLVAEQDALWAEAQRLSDQLVAQQAANGQSTESNPGGYIWPVNSRYITSTMGGRNSPGGIGSTNHKGTDIGRVGYTSSIYAAKSGKVIVS